MGTTFLSLFGVALYALGALLQWQSAKHSHTDKVHTLAVGGVAVLVHLLALALAKDISILGLVGIVSLTTATIVAVVIIASLRSPIESLLLAAYPLAATALLLSLHLPSGETAELSVSKPVALHIALSLVAFALLLVATLQAITLTWQNRQLKQHSYPRMLSILPPLQTTERALFGLIWIGLITLTLAMITGALYVDDLFGQNLAHKTILSILSWLLFATLLYGRHVWGWRGVFAARLTLTGAFLLALGFLGSKFVIEILLNPTGA